VSQVWIEGDQEKICHQCVDQCYALLRMRPLSILYAEGFIVYLCGERSFIYSAVTQFDTVNTSKDSVLVSRAGKGVIFGLVSFECGGNRFDSLGASLLFSGQNSAIQKNMVASIFTRGLRSETRVWIGIKQARTFLQQCRHMKVRGKS
jgi:hypothetical protein